MKRHDSPRPEGRRTVGLSLALGAVIGAAAGAALGAVSGDVGYWMGMGIPAGISVGLAAGAVFTKPPRPEPMPGDAAWMDAQDDAMPARLHKSPGRPEPTRAA